MRWASHTGPTLWQSATAERPGSAGPASTCAMRPSILPPAGHSTAFLLSTEICLQGAWACHVAMPLLAQQAELVQVLDSTRCATLQYCSVAGSTSADGTCHTSLHRSLDEREWVSLRGSSPLEAQDAGLPDCDNHDNDGPGRGAWLHELARVRHHDHSHQQGQRHNGDGPCCPTQPAGPAAQLTQHGIPAALQRTATRCR